MGFYEVPAEDRHWGVLLNQWRPVGGSEPRKRGAPPAARRPASRPKGVLIDPVLRGPVEVEE